MQKPFYEVLVCPECHIGRLSPTRTTYVHQYGETMISIPNIPAWRCDVCHACQYDDQPIGWLETIIIGQSNLPPNRYQPTVPRVPRRADARTENKTASEPVKARPKAK